MRICHGEHIYTLSLRSFLLQFQVVVLISVALESLLLINFLIELAYKSVSEYLDSTYYYHSWKADLYQGNTRRYYEEHAILAT